MVEGTGLCENRERERVFLKDRDRGVGVRDQ
jgi:hypothetical protein